jgi:hypothetical protein
MEKTFSIWFMGPVLAAFIAGPGLAETASEAVDRCLARAERATVEAFAQPPEDIAARLQLLASQDSGCIGTALSACMINPFNQTACLDDVSRVLQSHLSRAMASHPVEEDRPETLRAAYDHWRGAPPAPCDPKVTGGEEVCAALGLGGRLIEARGWARRFDLEGLD